MRLEAGRRGVLHARVGLGHVAQVLRDDKVALASVAAAEAGHFLFPLSVVGVLPGQLGACLHDAEGGGGGVEKRQERKPKTQTNASSSSSSPVGEEGDEGEGGVVGVCEDVLEEEVRLAAVL